MNDHHPFLLVVEDDEDCAILLKRAFLKAGVPDGSFRRYRDGESALAELALHDARLPSALLLDLELPGMSGLSVLERVRSCERLAQTPAFFLTGREDPPSVARARALGARAFWVKPWDFGPLVGIVRRIWDSLDRAGHATFPGSLLNRE